MLSLRSDRDGMGSRQTMALRFSHSQISQRFKSRDLRCRKLPTDDSIMEEMAAEQFVHAAGDVGEEQHPA